MIRPPFVPIAHFYPVRIAVNTRLLLPDKLEGIGWFAQESLRRIVRSHPEHEFIYLFDRPWDERALHGPHVRPVVVPPPTRHPLLYHVWLEWMLPRVLRRERVDALISPDGFLSLSAPTDLPQLAVIHDLNFEHHPGDLPWSYRTWYRSRFPRFARRADRIVTVSEFSKQDIVMRYGIGPERIDVVYNGVSKVFGPVDEQQARAARERLAGGHPYLVCVGSLHPRKNIARLLAAFDRVAAEWTDLRLVIVGEAFWWDRRMKEAWRAVRHKDRILFTGRLGQEALRDAVGAALAMVYVSYFEGFGIPVAEAMRCGVPVVAARATSLPEVAGDAAVYCDPFQVEDIADAMRRVVASEKVRAELARAGLQRAARYDWDHTARGLWNSFTRMMRDRGHAIA